MISAKNISYKVGEKQILNNVSFDALAGELLVILGNNGAGKSTLLKAICGEIKTKGEVCYKEKKSESFSLTELAKKRAVLKQHTQVNLPFLVKEIVMMGRYCHFKNKETASDFELVNEAMNRAGVAHLAEQNYLTLSGGEQQRVQLARVLAQVAQNEKNEVQYLFLDEPVSSLDVVHQHNTLRIAKAFAQKGNCVIAVLHDLNLAAMYADKVLLLKQENLLRIGKPEEVFTNHILSDTFGFPAFVQEHPYSDCLMVCFGEPVSIKENKGQHALMK